MRNIFTVCTAVILAVGLAGCGQQPKSASSQEAIQQSKELTSAEEQTKYLISEANAFINSKQFNEAISTAQYVLSNLDKESQAAQSILEKAKTELAALAKKKADEVTGDMKDKLKIGQ